MITSRPIPLRTRNISDEICSQNQNTYLTFSNFFLSENRDVYEIIILIYIYIYIWWSRTGTACWITKATDTHSEYVKKKLIGFPRQQWLRERASILPLYVHC